MKMRLAFVMIFSSFFSLSQAQKIQIGLTGALSFNNVSGNGMSDKPQTGIDGGAYVLIPLDDNFSVQPEVLYNLAKVNRADNFTTYYVDHSRIDSRVSFNLGYISIPVLINYKINPKFYVSAGPQINILSYSNENLMYDRQAFKNTDFGIRGGLKFAPSSDFSLFANYYYGIANINNIDTRYKWQNRQLEIGINVAVFNTK